MAQAEALLDGPAGAALLERFTAALDEDLNVSAGWAVVFDWVREMKRYGVLTAEVKFGDPIDIYATERKYWESLWFKPEGK